MYANGGGVGSMMQPKKKSYKDQKLTAAEKKKVLSAARTLFDYQIISAKRADMLARTYRC